MNVIEKKAGITAMKFETLNDITDIVSFTGAYIFNYDGSRLMCHSKDFNYVAPKLGQYVVKLANKLLTLTQEEFESL